MPPEFFVVFELSTNNTPGMFVLRTHWPQASYIRMPPIYAMIPCLITYSIPRQTRRHRRRHETRRLRRREGSLHSRRHEPLDAARANTPQLKRVRDKVRRK